MIRVLTVAATCGLLLTSARASATDTAWQVAATTTTATVAWSNEIGATEFYLSNPEDGSCVSGASGLPRSQPLNPYGHVFQGLSPDTTYTFTIEYWGQPPPEPCESETCGPRPCDPACDW